MNMSTSQLFQAAYEGKIEIVIRDKVQSDYQLTGKLYPKLDSYMVLQRKESEGIEVYLGSSNQFKTQKKYRDWILSQPQWSHLKIKIMRGE